jgi:DNA-binding SARP family transcriptional activator
VRVRCLGGFSLEAQSEQRAGAKPQEKPLELLRLLAACEVLSGGTAERSWLTDHLWPDADPANARKSLDMTVARLRKLLGREIALVWVDGRLQLADDVVWLDLRAFMHAAREAQRQIDDWVMQRGDAAALLRFLSQLVRCYGGPFLSGQGEGAWLIGVRKRVSQLFRSTVTRALDLLELPAAERVALLQRALAAEPDGEDFARRLMAAQLQTGDPAGAIAVFDALCSALVLCAGASPTASTRDLHRSALQLMKTDPSMVAPMGRAATVDSNRRALQ